MAHSRKIVIGGNWKMNLLPSEVSAYADNLIKYMPKDCKTETIIAVPFVMLPLAQLAFGSSSVVVAAQNVSEYDVGAYTGEVSIHQLRDLGITHVIVGHSERRTIFGESDSAVNAKVTKLLKNSMTPILCVGESEDIRTSGSTEDFISAQLSSALSGVSINDILRVIIAYEPIWAIGTGITATTAQAEDVCAFIRAELRNKFGSIADSVTVIYGGSMNSGNAEELLRCKNIDGGLIGGASLSPDTFAQIINTANKLA